MSKSTMRKMAPAVALTGWAVALVALFDPGVHALAGGHETESAAAPKAATSTDNTTRSDSAAKSSSGSKATPAPTQKSSPSPTAETASCDTAEVVKGPVITTRWGPVQVAAAVVGGTVCSAEALQWPDGDQRSAEISDYSIPILNEQAVKQNGDISGVSGASYTSYGYYQSLQAILDQAG